MAVDTGMLAELTAGGPAMEAYFEEYRITEARTGPGGVSFGASSSCGLGLRAVADGACGFASTSDCSPAGLATTRAAALAAQAASSPTGAALPDDYGMPGPGDSCGHPSLDRARAEEVRDLLRATCEAIVNDLAEPTVSRLEIGHRRVAFAASGGVTREFSAAYFTSTISARLADGTLGTAVCHGRDLTAFSPASLAGEAIAQARLRAAPAGHLPAGRTPVALAPAVTARVLVCLAPLFVPAAAWRPPSAASVVTIADDPLADDIVGSAPFDGEGVAGRRKVLIDCGEPAEALADAATARGHATASAGNACRYAYHKEPAPGPSVLVWQPGPHPAADIVAGVGDGFLVEQLTGPPRLDRGTGALTLTAAGRRIRSGAIAEPAGEVMLACFAAQLLAGVVAVGADLRQVGGAQAPMIAIDGLTLIPSPARTRERSPHARS
jgi:PmbA protein